MFTEPKKSLSYQVSKIYPLKNIKRTYKISFSKLQVRKKVTSKVRFGNGHNHVMLVIQK